MDESNKSSNSEFCPAHASGCHVRDGSGVCPLCKQPVGPAEALTSNQCTHLYALGDGNVIKFERCPWCEIERLRAALSDLHGLVLKRASYTEMEVRIEMALSGDSPAPETKACPPFDAKLNASIEAVARILQEEAASDPHFPVRGLANYAAAAGRIIRAVASSPEETKGNSL